MNYIILKFPITNKEYEYIEKEFGHLMYYNAWELIRKNKKNYHTDDIEDVVQEVRFASIQAVSYFKRQIYIESCMKVLEDHFNTTQNLAPTIKSQEVSKLKKLNKLWENRTKHGANRQKFGEREEKILEDMIVMHIPENARPDKNQDLKINPQFVTYYKTIIWNKQKNIGKKITKEKAIRNGMVSLSEYEYLGSGGI